jgi:hypothetical protein
VGSGQRGKPFRLAVEKTVVRDHEPADALFGEPGKGRLEIVLGPGIENLNRQAERLTGLLKSADLRWRKRVCVVDQRTNNLCGRDQAMQQLELFRLELGAERNHAGGVATRPVQAVDQTERHRIAPGQEHDRNRFGERLGGNRTGNLAGLHDHADRPANQVAGHGRQPIGLLLRK